MKILFVSLGCDKNMADSEEVLGKLAAHGYSITDDERAADIIIINTCCFILDAKEESIQTILEMAQYRTEGTCKALIVMGCLVQRYREEIHTEIPEIDAIMGTTAYDEVLDVIPLILKGQYVERFRDINALPLIEEERLVPFGVKYSYLKIAEGCDKHCTYCIIPNLKGQYRSIPMEHLLAEAQALVSQGVRELILVAQETTLYGVDLYGEKSLHRLLDRLCEIPDLAWIRILYCYPEELYPEMIAVMKNQPKICHYLDIPIQHASDPVLKRMGRHTTSEELRSVIHWLRQEIPDLVLRTTLITGFPGETEDDFQALAAFVEEIRFEHLGVFPYSEEEDTPAAVMPDQIPQSVKEQRRDELMQLQQQIVFESGKARIGSLISVMIEGEIPEEDVYIGRSYADAPSVDGTVFVRSSRFLLAGEFVKVRITSSLEYDLIGETEDEYTE